MPVVVGGRCVSGSSTKDPTKKLLTRNGKTVLRKEGSGLDVVFSWKYFAAIRTFWLFWDYSIHRNPRHADERKALINKWSRHLKRGGVTFGQGLSQGPVFSVLTRCKSNKSIERVILRAGDMHWKYSICKYHQISLKMLWAVLSRKTPLKKYCNSPKIVWKVFKEFDKQY